MALALMLALCVPAALQAQDFPSRAQGMVNDFADLIPRTEEARLETKLRNYRDTTTNALVIATLPSLKGLSIEEVATTLFNDWRMWHEERYNGVLILVAPNERQMRIEVGYGLEGAIPDVMAGRIVRNVLTPAFREGDFYGGLDRATTILIELAQGEYEGDLTSTRQADDDLVSGIIFLLFLAFVIYASTRRGGRGNGRRRRTFGPSGFIWLGGGSSGGGFSSGGGGFGGFSGGGGFGSGGGGASGGW